MIKKNTNAWQPSALVQRTTTVSTSHRSPSPLAPDTNVNTQSLIMHKEQLLQSWQQFNDGPSHKNRPTEMPSRLADEGTRVVWCFQSASFQLVSTVSGTHWLRTFCSFVCLRTCSEVVGASPRPPIDPPPSTLEHPTPYTSWEKELVFLKSGLTVDQRKSGPCSTTPPPLEGLFICVSPDGSGHDVATPSSAFTKRSYKWSFWTASRVCSALDH